MLAYTPSIDTALLTGMCVYFAEMGLIEPGNINQFFYKSLPVQGFAE